MDVKNALNTAKRRCTLNALTNLKVPLGLEKVLYYEMNVRCSSRLTLPCGAQIIGFTDDIAEVVVVLTRIVDLITDEKATRPGCGSANVSTQENEIVTVASSLGLFLI